MKQTYTTRDVASIVGISESRVRYWAQTGVVGPSSRGRTAYTFADLVSVKAAKELLDGGVTLQRARKNLEALRSQLGGDRPLARLRVCSDGERLVVSDGAATFEPLTGQLVLDFGLDELSGQVAELTAPTRPAEPARQSAWTWFVEAGQHEAHGDDEAALAAYREALAHDPALAAAYTNLGNLYYRRGERGQARSHYEEALTLDPEQPEARFNLGNVYDDLGDASAARLEWYRVVTACPEFADAHYNLAVASGRDGDVATARLHLTRYLELRPDDVEARALVEQL
jgi:tetratricopeptide (TPR) repeat protein